MLVVDLHCDQDHAFEGWFASGDELGRQQAAGMLSCPVCGSHAVQRRPSATRLNVSAPKAPVNDGAAAFEAAYLQLVRQVLKQTVDVGAGFVDEVRRIHHGDAPQRAIRGQATSEERAELREEGIETVALPMPKGIDEPLQ